MKTKTSREWDKVSEEYRNLVNSEDDAYENIINTPAFLKLLPHVAKNVLDIGCGSGEFTYQLSKLYKNTSGCDASPNMVEISRQQFPNIKFFVQDLETKFELEDKSYDLITAKMVLMFIENLDLLAKESYRILQKNGLLILSIIHPMHWTKYYLMDKYKVKQYPEFEVMENGYFSKTSIRKSIAGNSSLTFNFINRSLEDYLEPFLKEGFLLKELNEPQITSDFIKKHNDFSSRSDVPMRLNLSLVKR